MNVLVGCEVSGTVRDAFRRAGHAAWSCDLSDSPGSEFHLCGDVLEFLHATTTGEAWDLFIVHPPCDYFSASGLHWTARRLRPLSKTEDALRFVNLLLDGSRHIPKVALENPVGFLSRALRKPDQIIQPWQFGHDASKRTCLWLRGLPLLRATKQVAPRIVNGLPRWANQTDSGQNKLAPSPTRAADRARTYDGIAEAMADQWGRIAEAAAA